MRVGPVAFLLAVPLAWGVVRAVMLWPEATPEPDARQVAWAPPLSTVTRLRARRPQAELKQVAFPVPTTRNSVRFERSREVGLKRANTRLSTSLETNGSKNAPLTDGAAPPAFSAFRRTDVRQSVTNRLSLSTWLLLRGDVLPVLAAGGQLGGSQAGLRARFALSDEVHLATRVSGPLRSGLGKEAAVALDVRPIASVPVTVSLERRIGLDRGGRDAFAIGAFGGFDRAVAPGFRVNGYAQLGVVGLKRRDAYVDGALRAERDALTSGRLRLGVGAGVWGGAQPGAARLDLGPQAVAHAGRFRLSVEWRQRVAGTARPGSGPALSLGADF